MGSEHLSEPKQQERFRRLLLAWFLENARDLPWRRTHDPYAIWVSEIMLQQTRVNAVLDHYARFLHRFPTVEALAAAEEPEVLTLWSGLGYYRRARMLHKAARFVVQELGGVMPQTAAGLRTLPGVGDYTSAAISSIAFGEAAAAVDGNVERVMTRLYALTSEPEPKAVACAIRRHARELIDPNHAGDFNQAMMELGATLCLPRNPQCLHCPVQPLCLTRGEHPTVPRKEMSSRRVAYAFLRRSGRNERMEILLEQRPAKASLMAGMWELPQIEDPGVDDDRLLLHVRHSITTTNYYVSILLLLPEEKRQLPRTGAERKWVKTSDLLNLPLTGLARKVLKRLHVLPGYTSGSVPVQMSMES